MLLGAGAGAHCSACCPGDFVTVISPKGALTAVGHGAQDATLRRGRAPSRWGMYEFDASIAYLPLAAARDFAGLRPA